MLKELVGAGAGQAFVVSVEMPAFGRVAEASRASRILA